MLQWRRKFRTVGHVKRNSLVSISRRAFKYWRSRYLPETDISVVCNRSGRAMRECPVFRKFIGRWTDPIWPLNWSLADAAAKACFSNWVSGSSSFSFFCTTEDRLSGSRFSSQSGLAFEGRRCMHVSDWQWRAPLSGALRVAQQTFSASSTDLVRIGRSCQGWWLTIGSCLASHLFLTEFCAVDPHPVQKDGEFTGDGDSGTTAAFGAH